MENKIDTSRLSGSNADFADSITSQALKTLEFLIKTQANEKQDAMNLSVSPVTSGLKILDKQWNPEVANDVEKNLESINQLIKSNEFGDNYTAKLKNYYDNALAGFKIYESSEKLLSSAETKLQTMKESLGVLEDPTTAASEVLNDIGRNEATIIGNSKNISIDNRKRTLDNVIQETTILQDLSRIDRDDNAGLQLEMRNVEGAILAEKLGFVKDENADVTYTENNTKLASYYLPQEFDRNIDLTNDKDIKTLLQSIEKHQIDREKNIVTREEKQVFIDMNDLSLQQGTPAQAGFTILVESMMGTNKDDNVNYDRFIDDLKSGSGDLAQDTELAEQLENYRGKLTTLWDNGQYDAEFNKLLTRTSALKLDQISAKEEGDKDRLTLISEQKESVAAAGGQNVMSKIDAASQSIKNLTGIKRNEEMNQDDLDKFRRMIDVDIPVNIGDNVDTVIQNSPQIRNNIVRSFDQLLDTQDKDPFTNEPKKVGTFRKRTEGLQGISKLSAEGQEDLMLQYTKATTNTKKYEILRKLTTEYISPVDGTYQNQKKVANMFGNFGDGGELSFLAAQELASKQADAFYSLLDAFSSVDGLIALPKIGD